jgi:hypothetical protein
LTRSKTEKPTREEMLEAAFEPQSPAVTPCALGGLQQAIELCRPCLLGVVHVAGDALSGVSEIIKCVVGFGDGGRVEMVAVDGIIGGKVLWSPPAWCRTRSRRRPRSHSRSR